MRPLSSFSRLRAFRLERGWTQANLANLVGWSTALVSSVERGMTPSDEQLRKLARGLGITVEAARALCGSPADER